MNQSGPPLNTSFSPPQATIMFEPYVSHILSSVIKDLQFLQQQGYISQVTLDEIVEKLQRPAKVPAPPHTPPAPSLSSSPIPQQDSPTVSTKSDTSQKQNSTVSTLQRPSSQTSQRNDQSTLHPTVEDKPDVEYDHHQDSVPQRKPTPPQLTISPQLHNIPPPPPPKNENVVDELRPDIPSRVSSFQPIPPPQSVPNTSSNIISNTNTGAILATRPLPLPPNATSTSPPRPQPLPVFNNKFEEFEHERSKNHQRDTILPPYSVSTVEAMWDFIGNDPGDLSFKKGDTVEVVEYVNADWWRGRIQGTSNIGIFPKIYTKILTRNAAHENSAAYFSRLPQNYPSNFQRSQHSPSIQNQQLPPTQQLPLTQQNFTTYVQLQQHQQAYTNDSRYLNTRNSTSSLNGPGYYRQEI